MLDLKNKTIKDYIQRVAIPQGKYHSAKDNSGKLLNYSPKVGQIIVLEGFETYGVVIKGPNFNRDFLIEVDSLRIRKNLVNKDIEGYIDP
jgi:hypothetical protein